jgi:hypothetical protein
MAYTLVGVALQTEPPPNAPADGGDFGFIGLAALVLGFVFLIRLINRVSGGNARGNTPRASAVGSGAAVEGELVDYAAREAERRQRAAERAERKAERLARRYGQPLLPAGPSVALREVGPRAREMDDDPMALAAELRDLAPSRALIPTVDPLAGLPPKERATVAERQLPPTAQINMHDLRLNSIPILFDGAVWYVLDLLASMHWRICGASRSGKGNVLQLIALLAAWLGPDRAWVWILDPKDGLDYRAFAPQLRHTRLYADVYELDADDEYVLIGGNRIPVFDGDLESGYGAAVKELRRRNRLIGDAGARNHIEYERRTGQRLPVLIVVADEVSEIDDDQRACLETLARTGAAAGVVLIVATQYPTAAYLPSQVQANCLNSLVFQFGSSKYTEVAMGLARGEKPVFDPAGIKQRGVAILRNDGGEEHLGRVPFVSDEAREQLIAALLHRYARTQPSAVANGPDMLSQRHPVNASDLDYVPLDRALQQAAAVANAADDEAVPETAQADDPVARQQMLKLLRRLLTTFPETKAWDDRQWNVAVELAYALLGGRELSGRELGMVAYPTNKHGGGGTYSAQAAKIAKEVQPVVDQVLLFVNGSGQLAGLSSVE